MRDSLHQHRSVRTVLMISYYFPPYDSTAAVEALKFASFLPEFGWDPIVVTARNDFPPTLASTDSIEVYRTKQLDLNAPLKRLAGQKRVSVAGYTTPPDTMLGRLMSIGGRLYRQSINFPDGQIGWYPYAIREARRVIRSVSVCAVVSSAYPVTNHLVAQKVAGEARVPWIADFRDLWTDNHHFRRTRILRRVEERLESKIVRRAAHLSVPSGEWAALLHERFGKPVSVIPNAFDPKDYPVPPPPDDRFTLTYTGVFYPSKQDPAPLFEAIAELKRRGLIKPEDFRFRLVGRYVEQLMPLVEKLGISDLTMVGPSIAHQEALRLQLGSTALVFLSWAPESGGGWYSAKIYEYLGARRPVLVVGTEGPPAEMVRKLSAGATAETREEIVQVLERWLAEHKATGQVAVGTDPAELTAFEWRASVEILAGILDEVISRQNPGRLRDPDPSSA